MIAAQFGNSSEVASAFFEAYKPDRVALYSIYWFVLALASFAAVTAVFLVVEALAAIEVGDVVNLTSADLRSGVIGLMALTWGYCGLFVGEKVFRRYSLLKSALLNVGLFALAVSVAHVVAPWRTLAPIVAFGCSASVCILQRAGMRLAWLVGSLGPLVFVRLVNGHVLSGIEQVNLRADDPADTMPFTPLGSKRWEIVAELGGGLGRPFVCRIFALLARSSSQDLKHFVAHSVG